MRCRHILGILCIGLFFSAYLSACKPSNQSKPEVSDSQSDGAFHNPASSAPQKESAFNIVDVAGNQLFIPNNLEHWKYSEIAGANSQKYMQIVFNLNIDSFEPLEAKYGKHITNNFNLEIRPLRSEFGEQGFWSDKDPILNSTEEDCSEIEFEGKQVLYCKNKNAQRVVSGADSAYSIKDIKTGQHISIFGCLDSDKFKSLNPTCTGRSQISDSLQIEYVYRAENFSRAVELDEKARAFVFKLLNKH